MAGGGAVLPAWVQAIGALLALFVAISLAQWQRNYDRQRRRLELRERRLAACAILEAVLSSIKQGHFRPFELDEPAQILSSIPLTDFPAEAARRVVVIRQLVNRARMLVSEGYDRDRSSQALLDAPPSSFSYAGVYDSAQASQLLDEVRKIVLACA